MADCRRDKELAGLRLYRTHTFARKFGSFARRNQVGSEKHERRPYKHVAAVDAAQALGFQMPDQRAVHGTRLGKATDTVKVPNQILHRRPWRRVEISLAVAFSALPRSAQTRVKCAIGAPGKRLLSHLQRQRLFLKRTVFIGADLGCQSSATRRGWQ